MAKKADYEKEKKIWYKKLKDSGFEDIEKDEYNLKQWSNIFSKPKSLALIESRQAYYIMASKFINDYTFETELDAVIWEYHANAISVRDIAKLLSKAKIKETNRTTVWLTIKRLEHEMKRMYLIGYQDE